MVCPPYLLNQQRVNPPILNSQYTGVISFLQVCLEIISVFEGIAEVAYLRPPRITRNHCNRISIGRGIVISLGGFKPGGGIFKRTEYGAFR